MMNRVAIVTDSNSGITQEDAKKLGIYLLPMPFFINGQEYFEDISLSQSDFYKKMAENDNITTSQPAVGDILDLWNHLLESHDEIVHIPMSSALSGSCDTATTLAEDFDGRIQVINNQRISVTQMSSALDALNLAKSGKSAHEIKEILEQSKHEQSIYITVDSLKYLKKGGRITPAAAAIGTVLNLKPILQIQGGKLDAFSKCRGMKQSRKIMIDAMVSDFDKRFGEAVKNHEMCLYIAHTNNIKLAEEFKEQSQESFPDYDIKIYPLSLSVACHIGPNSLALACARKIV